MNAFKLLLILSLGAVLACSNAGSNEKSENNDSTAVKDDSVADSRLAISNYAKTLPLDKIKLPAGFKIDVYAEVDNARSLAISPSGVIYVGNRNGDKVYAVKDTDGDFKADKKWVI